MDVVLADVEMNDVMKLAGMLGRVVTEVKIQSRTVGAEGGKQGCREQQLPP